MWSKTKASVRTIVLQSSTAPQSVVINIPEKENFSIQLNYGAGAGPSTAKLQSSDDGVNYADIPDSEESLDVTGGMVKWNVNGEQGIFLKVVITGDAVNCVVSIATYTYA